jgi:hypothetical protein
MKTKTDKSEDYEYKVHELKITDTLASLALLYGVESKLIQ